MLLGTKTPILVKSLINKTTTNVPLYFGLSAPGPQPLIRNLRPGARVWEISCLVLFPFGNVGGANSVTVLGARNQVGKLRIAASRRAQPGGIELVSIRAGTREKCI